jgi:DNA-binding CsgD family transcriptional regulator
VYHLARPKTDTVEESLAAAISSVGTADFIPTGLDYLRYIAPFRGCLLTLLNGTRRPVHLYDNVRVERRAEVVDRYLDEAYLLDPFYVAYRDHAPCDALRLNDVAPDRFQQSTYFKQYYHSIRLRDEMAILIDLPAGKHLFYSIGRLIDEPRFTAREITEFRRVLPIFSALNRRHFVHETYNSGPAEEGVPAEEIDAALARFGTDHLTEREREIASLILKGHSSKSIARIISISPGTVKIHRKNMYRKLQISSQSELFSLFLSALSGIERV